MSELTASTWMHSRGLRGLALLVALVFLGAALLFLFRLTHAALRESDRYAVAFADIDCSSPPHLSREDFLNEVRYLSDLPVQLSIVDEDLARRLAEAFIRHPWVETVQRIRITPQRQIRVWLTFRVPVLRVRVDKDGAAPGYLRLVDATGLALPGKGEADDLPVLDDDIPRPNAGGEGRWSDPSVAVAARTVHLLRPLQGQLGLTTLAVREGVLCLRTRSDSWVLWGAAPGDESEREAPAAVKCERLLDYCTRHGSLDQPEGPYEHDVRPLDQPLRRPLRPEK